MRSTWSYICSNHNSGVALSGDVKVLLVMKSEVYRQKESQRYSTVFLMCQINVLKVNFLDMINNFKHIN